MALPSTGAISLSMVNEELKKQSNSLISLNDASVRSLAKILSGTISMSDLRGKSAMPSSPEECDYYFETYDEAKASMSSILSEHNNDLSEITIGFGDSVTTLYVNSSSPFRGSSIVKSPKALFGRNITEVRYIFRGCSSLITVSPNLFYGCPNIIYFNYAFYNCTALKTLPSELFSKQLNAQRFNYAFYNCTALTTIPSGLFDNNTNIISYNGSFNGCTALTTIPSGLFDNNINVDSFAVTFQNCTALTTIPSGLFDNNINVTDFTGSFSGCTALTTIPSGLFDNNTNVTDFVRTFQNCVAVTSSIPDGWNETKHPNVTRFEYYADGCLKAANYSSIPSDWK